MSFLAPETPAMPAMPPPPIPEKAPGGKKRGGGMQPTFLGTGSVPEVTNLGGKTLLGQ